MGLLNKFRKEGSKKSMHEEVMQNVEYLLNTKATFGAWQKGMGLQSYAYNKSNLSVVNGIIDDIFYNIETYEKRIKVLGIEVIDNSSALKIRFQIDCLIGEKHHSFYVGFNNFPEPIYVEIEKDAENRH